MYLHNEIPAIPRYPLEPDGSGNRLIRVNKSDGVVNNRRSDFLVPHRKDYYFLVFVKTGSSRHWIDMTPYDLKPDTFYFTVPQQVHLKEQGEQLTGMSISMTGEFLAADGSGQLMDLPVIQNPNNGHELALCAADVVFLEDLLEKIYAEYKSAEVWQHSMLLGYVKVLLIYLSRLYKVQHGKQTALPERMLLRSYLAAVNERYMQLHEVAGYARLLNISPGHLSEVIKEQSGKPAIVHIHERLILEAKQLLFHTGDAIKEIAFILGFEDAAYFNRFFKRITGFTPVQYRRKFREMYH